MIFTSSDRGQAWIARDANRVWTALALPAGGIIQRRGMPALLSAGDEKPPRFSALFGRRINSGLDYQVQFTSDLFDWETSLAPPVPAGEDEQVEAFSVPFPNRLSNGRVPRFFRIKLTGP